MASFSRVFACWFAVFSFACGSNASGGDSPAAAGVSSAGASASGNATSAGAPGNNAGSSPGAGGYGGNQSTAGAAGSGGTTMTCTAFSAPTVSAIGLGNLVPKPLSVTPGTGAFALTATSAIYVEPGTPEMLAIGQYLADKLKPATGFSLPVAATVGAPCAGNLYLTTQGADASLGAEGYELSISPELVRLKAPQPAGVFRGLQTVRQLLPPSIESKSPQAGPWGLSAGTIRDLPRFAWRGTMLDVARHFFTVSEVQRFIDLAAYFKLNVFHLHLTDDQGFRIAINTWPKLTSVGGSTAVGGGAGGFYTQSDFTALVDYAKARYIDLVPELDVPGHTNAALASYAELNCNGQAPALRTDTLVGYSSLCIGSDKTYQFVGDVVKELAAITRSKYLHLGGDEANMTPVADFNAFFKKTIPLVTGTGKQLLGWDALGQLDSLPANTVVQYWISDDNARAAANKGAKILMSPAKRAYLDMKYTKETPLGQTWAATITEQQGYEWDPATFVSGIGESQLIGIEAPLWTEFLKTTADLEYLMFPRLIGHAEIGWSPTAGRNWEEYKSRLASHGPRLSAWNVNFYKSPAVPWP